MTALPRKRRPHRALSDRRQRRRRQEHADRPPAVRQPRHPGRPARRAGAPRRRQADRPVAADRRPGGRARAGHHHRRGLPLLRHQDAQVHHRRRPRPRAVHPQHGDRRRRQRRRGGAGGHHQARPDAAGPCRCCRRHAATRCWRSCCACPASCSPSTSSTPWPTPGEAFAGAARAAGLCREAGIAVAASCRCRRCAATTSPSRWPRLVHGPSLLQLLESLPDHAGAQRRPLCAAGAVRAEGPPRRGRGPTSRACCGAAWPTAPSRWATRCRCSPSGERAGWPALRRAGSEVDSGRPASRPAWCSTASSTCRAATGSSAPAVRRRSALPATLAWLDTEPARAGRKYWVRHGNRWVQARITAIDSVLDIHSLQPTDAHELAVNAIGQVVMECSSCRWSPMPTTAWAAR
jgi:hypothetical protein